jgi:hypothetical protein
MQGSSTSVSLTNLPHLAAYPQRQTADLQELTARKEFVRTPRRQSSGSSCQNRRRPQPRQTRIRRT